MPYSSEAQRRKFHAMLGRGEIDAPTVAEYDRASKGKNLPERARRRKAAERVGDRRARRRARRR